MAKCRECSNPVIWATVKNGKDAGKKRPFDPDGSDGGRYGLQATDETDNYGGQVVEATYYDDPIKGLESNDKLYDSHFFTCPAKKSGGRVYTPTARSSGGGDKVFVLVQVGGDDYSGYLGKASAPAKSEEDNAPF